MTLSLIKEIIKSFKKTDRKSIVRDGHKGFYIPSGRTLQAVEYRRELGLWEINDYMNYVINNYYMSDLNYEDLLNFTGQWAKYCKNPDEIEKHTRSAVSRIVNCLSNAKPINDVDILWASNRVYVNDVEPNLRRVIIRENKQDELDYKIINQAQDPQVATDMDWLIDTLNYKKHSKEVDNKL